MLDTHHLLQDGPFHVHGCWAHVAEPAVGGRGLPRRGLAGWGLGRDRGDLGTHRGGGLALRIPCMPRRRRKNREFHVSDARRLLGRRSDLDHALATHRRSPVRRHPMGRCDAARVATPSLAGSRPDLRLGERARQFRPCIRPAVLCLARGLRGRPCHGPAGSDRGRRERYRHPGQPIRDTSVVLRCRCCRQPNRLRGGLPNRPRPRCAPRSVSYSSCPCSRCSPSSRPRNHEPRGERYSRSPSSLCWG
jgi:hypothetical protein